jgi:hypothetical protein
VPAPIITTAAAARQRANFRDLAGAASNADFWLLFFVFMLAIGPGIMAQQNLPEMVHVARQLQRRRCSPASTIRQVDDLPGNCHASALCCRCSLCLARLGACLPAS